MASQDSDAIAVERLFRQAFDIKARSMQHHPGRRAWNAAPEFLRMTIMESQDAKHARGMHFEQRLNHCMALIRQAGELREGGELERSLSRYAAAISVFMWFERKPNSEDLPLRSVALSMPPDKRARAEQAIAEAMAGAGLACLESEQPDEAIYAASTALRLGGSTSLRASAIYLRARANIQRGTAQTLSRARDDLSSLIETLQSDDSAGNEAGHECPALEDVQAALAAVEEELRECKERERELARRMIATMTKEECKIEEDRETERIGMKEEAGEGTDTQTSPTPPTTAGCREGIVSDGLDMGGDACALAQEPAGLTGAKGLRISVGMGPHGSGPMSLSEASSAGQTRGRLTDGMATPQWRGSYNGMARGHSATGSLNSPDGIFMKSPKAWRAGGLSLNRLDPEVLHYAREMHLDLMDPMVLAQLDAASKAVRRESRRATGEGSTSESDDEPGPRRRVRSNRISIRGETQVTTSSRAPTWISVRNATRFAYVAITVYFGWRLYGVLTAPLSRPQMGAGTSAEQGVVAHGVDGGIEVALTARGIAAEQAGGEIFSGAALQEGAHHHAQESGVGGTQSDAAGTEL